MYPHDTPLIVTNQAGNRRTLRPGQIEDLEEVDATHTKVIYTNGRCVVVAMAFDDLYAEWTKEAALSEWLGA